VFWFSLQIMGEAFLVLRIQRDIIINVHTALWKVPVILVRFYWNLNFLDRFSRNAKDDEIKKLVKIGPLVAN